MSPLATCATSCAMTASTSSRFMVCSSPVDTATRAEFLNAPVAKALGAPSKMATSGMPILDFSAMVFTVATIQRCVGSAESLMSCAPVVHLAMGLLISSEMMAPPKPMISAKPNSVPMFRPWAVMKRFRPSRCAAMPRTSITATLVTTNSRIRFMAKALGGRWWIETARDFRADCRLSSRPVPRGALAGRRGGRESRAQAHLRRLAGRQQFEAVAKLRKQLER